MWFLVGGRVHLLEQILKTLDACFYPYSRKLRFWHLSRVGQLGTFVQGFESEACDIQREKIHPMIGSGVAPFFLLDSVSFLILIFSVFPPTLSNMQNPL